MTLTMADSISPTNLPAGYDAYLGYVDGDWPTAKALRVKFPAAHILTVTVLGGNAVADGCDVETGDLSPASGAAWALGRLADDAERPVIYASTGVMADVLGELAARKIGRSEVRLLSAHYTGERHICGPATCKLVDVAMDGTQWSDSAPGVGGTKIDASLLAGNFFGATTSSNGGHVKIETPPPGDWEGDVVVIGKGTDGNLWETRTSDGKTWSTPVKQ
jgi:hypothetical protein